jgi:hypothetical protein
MKNSRKYKNEQFILMRLVEEKTIELKIMISNYL